MNQVEQDQVATVIDLDDLLTRCMNNIDFAQRVIIKFQESSAENFVGIEEAIEAEDTESIAHLAHRLKGASANAAAGGLRDQAAELEDAALRRSLADVHNQMENLKQEWERFTSAVPHIDLYYQMNVQNNPTVAQP